MKEQIEGEIRVSVRNLVEFLLRQGDIDNRHHAAPDNAMQEGGRIHRMIQRRMGAEYQAEVPLKYTLQTSEYQLTVEGRADGIIHHEGQVVIDEIKGTYRELARMREPSPLHVAQAKSYAYMCALKEELTEVQIRLTYCNIITEELRYFYEDYTFRELEEWFGKMISAYRRWADDSFRWRALRQASIEELEFPFPYREGQKELVTNVYRTIYHKRKLFLEAPTGVGKTISTVFPAVQAMGRGMAEKLFYLTAKTITRTVAEDALEILRRKGLHFRSVILTAKEKICFMEETNCNPEYCPYAKGHYDRINEAMYELLTSEESFSRDRIEQYAQKHRVCPFEMCLDMALFADGIICDYNYLFDPHIYLKRFFGEGADNNHIFLIDEAHNLLERGREMYSAALNREAFLELRKELKETVVSETAKKPDFNQLTLKLTEMSESGELLGEGEELGEVEKGLLTENAEPGVVDSRRPAESAEPGVGVSCRLTESAGLTAGGRKGGRMKAKSVLVKDGYADKLIYGLEKCNEKLLAMQKECPDCCVVENLDVFVQPLMRLHAAMDEYLSEQEEEQLPAREQLLDFYFAIGHFLEMYELADENYVKYTQLGEDGSFFVKLFCVNPGENLGACMQRGRSSVLFSATFLPIQYYKRLLGGTKEDYEVYAQSIFQPERRALLIASDVTSRYARRSEEEYYNIARYIDEIVQGRYGNYMVFCPSYAFLQAVYDKYRECFAGENKECILQEDSMREAEREAFLARFRGNENLNLQADIAMEIEEEEHTLIGFCVLGGIFGEGIDLKNDSLIGAVIVGTGLPQVCNEREILKGYFDEEGENGFDYAYRYPGMNKVLQAAGRVIRTVEDVGVIALLDERFLQPAYRRMFPREWAGFETVTVDNVKKHVEQFWDAANDIVENPI